MGLWLNSLMFVVSLISMVLTVGVAQAQDDPTSLAAGLGFAPFVQALAIIAPIVIAAIALGGRIAKAKRPDSDGGTRITAAEAEDIFGLLATLVEDLPPARRERAEKSLRRVLSRRGVVDKGGG